MEEKHVELLKDTDSRHKHDRLYATETPDNTQWNHCLDLWEQAGITDEERDALGRDLAHLQPQTIIDDDGTEKPETPFKWQVRLRKERIDLAALKWFWAALGDEPETAYIRVDHNQVRRPYEFNRVSKDLPKYSEKIIVLDGTGYKAEVDGLFERNFNLIDGTVELPNCKRIFLQQPLGKKNIQHADDAKLEKLFKQAAGYLNKDDKRILIGTHKIIEQQISEIAKRILPGREIETIHYFQGRGINRYKDFDVYLGFGTPTVNPAGVLDTALVMFDDPAEREQWTDSQGRNDLIQTLHRIRPVNGNKKIIIMGRSWPNEIGKPDFCPMIGRGVGSEKFDLAYERIRAFVSEFGFITREISTMIGIGHKSDSGLIESVFNSVQNRACFLIINTLLGNMVKNGTSLNTILFGDVRWWDHQIITRLKIDFPDLPDLMNKKPGARNYTTGIGTLDAARRFYESLNRGEQFDRESWTGQEKPEPIPEPVAIVESNPLIEVLNDPWLYRQPIPRGSPERPAPGPLFN